MKGKEGRRESQVGKALHRCFKGKGGKEKESKSILSVNKEGENRRVKGEERRRECRVGKELDRCFIGNEEERESKVR